MSNEKEVKDLLQHNKLTNIHKQDYNYESPKKNDCTIIKKLHFLNKIHHLARNLLKIHNFGLM